MEKLTGVDCQAVLLVQIAGHLSSFRELVDLQVLCNLEAGLVKLDSDHLVVLERVRNALMILCFVKLELPCEVLFVLLDQLQRHVQADRL